MYQNILILRMYHFGQTNGYITSRYVDLRMYQFGQTNGYIEMEGVLFVYLDTLILECTNLVKLTDILKRRKYCL